MTIPNNKKPIERGFEDNQYYIPRSTFSEIPNWKPHFQYAHPPLFTEGHRYEPSEAIERHVHIDKWEDGIRFVNEVSECAIRYNHHPKIIINMNIVTVIYYTHTKSCTITNKDLYMAKKIDEIVERFEKNE